jgi:hypothetical protein
MTTKQRFRNKYTLQVRERDHNPPHVHFYGAGYDVIILLESLEFSGNFPSNTIQNEVMAWVGGNQNELFKEWYLWHTK